MYVNWDGHTVRLILRVYFIVSALILGIIGRECCKALVRLDLVRRKVVALERTTGWLSGFGFVASLWDLGNLPGGAFMGIVMLLATVLTPAADLAVGGLVRNVHFQSRCAFGQGIVLDPYGPFVFSGPPVNGRPKAVATNAQLTSVANGGLQGIYLKVNSDTNFAAEAQDVLAGWVCTDLVPDVNYGNNVVIAEVLQDLVGRGYLYANNLNFISLGPAFGHEHFVAWSSSATANNSPWDLKASIDISALPTDPVVMRSFRCGVNSHAADDILSSLNMSWTLNDWLQDFQGGCYDGSNTSARADAPTFIEQLLNTMLMVQAGANSLLRSPSSGSDPTQGCLAVKADIPVAIFALVGIFGVLLLATLSWWIAVLIRTARVGLRKKKVPNRQLLDLVPCGLTSWMLHAARESAMHRKTKHEPTETKLLKKWKLAVTKSSDGSQEVARLVDEREKLGDEGPAEASDTSLAVSKNFDGP